MATFRRKHHWLTPNISIQNNHQVKPLRLFTYFWFVWFVFVAAHTLALPRNSKQSSNTHSQWCSCIKLFTMSLLWWNNCKLQWLFWNIETTKFSSDRTITLFGVCAHYLLLIYLCAAVILISIGRVNMFWCFDSDFYTNAV